MTWANVYPDLCCKMVSLGYNELLLYSSNTLIAWFLVIDIKLPLPFSPLLITVDLSHAYFYSIYHWMMVKNASQIATTLKSASTRYELDKYRIIPFWWLNVKTTSLLMQCSYVSFSLCHQLPPQYQFYISSHWSTKCHAFQTKILLCPFSAYPISCSGTIVI